MGKRFEIRFDKHGNILIDDPELQRRLKYLLETNGELVLRLKDEEGGSIDPVPRLLGCPVMAGCPILRNAICPNAMCACGALRVIHEEIWEQGWNGLDGPGLEQH